MTSEDPAFRERLTAYLDDQLSSAEAREFLELLQRDPVAMRRLEEARRVWALLGAYRDEPVPEGFAESVLEKMAADGASGDGTTSERSGLRLLAGGRSRFALATAATVVAALGLGVVWALRALDPAQPTDPASSTLATLEAVPPGLLDSLDADSLTRIASLSDEEFDALLSAEPQDLADGTGKREGPK